MKILYKLLKIAGVLTLAMIIFMILTVVVAKIFEDELASFTIDKLESRIKAPLSVGKVSIVPLFSFPRLSAEINKLTIGDPKSQHGDTLLFINSLKVGLNSWDLMVGIYTIDEMEISGLDFDYELDSSGKSNIDFIINAFTDTTSVIDVNEVPTDPLNLSAEKLTLANINIKYYDRQRNIGSQVTIPEIIIKAKTKNNIYQAKTSGSFILSHCLIQDTKLDQMESCNISFELEYKDKEASIQELSIISEGVNLGVKGFINTNNGLALNTNIEATNLDFNILKKYMPSQYSDMLENTILPPLESISLDINMEYQDEKVELKRLLLYSKGLELGVAGTFILSDTVSVNANIESLKLDFKSLKKYIPGQYANEYGIMELGGIMDISAKIAGKYADSTLLPLIKADVNLKNITVQTKDYPKIDALNLTALLTSGEKADMSQASINISNCEIVSNNSHVQLGGNAVGLENPTYTIRSSMDLNLKEFEGLIRDSLVQNLEGNVIASINTSGKLPNSISKDFIDYVLNNSTISLSVLDVYALLSDSIQVEGFSTNIEYVPQEFGAKKIQIDNLNLKSSTLRLNLQNSSLSATLSGKVSDPIEMSAHIQSFNVQSGKSQIMGIGEVSNFETPEFNINTSIILNLEDVMPFAPDSLIKNMTGTVKADIRSKGKMNPDSLDSQLFPILFENSSFDLAFSNISLAFSDSIMNVDHISAHIGLKDDVLTIDDFSTEYKGLIVKMDSSKVQNIYKAVILNQKEELYVDAYIKIGDIFFDDFKHLMALGETNANLQSNSEDTPLDQTITEEARNWTYLIHGSATVSSVIIDSTNFGGFHINRLHVNELSSLFKLTDTAYIVDQFKFKVFEGEMNNSLHYKVRNDGTQTLSMHNIIEGMNIQTMMKDMDNFGMDSLITYKNISGLFSTDLNAFVPIDDSVLIDKMMLSGDIILERGGVYDYPPAAEISKFTSIKELDNIQFKTLRSNIFMFKNKLYVPRTNIVSNALDIAAFGMQDLGGGSEYHMEVHLSNILFGKSEKRNKKQDSAGEEIDVESLKKSSHQIRYAVSERKSKVGKDTKEARDAMMNKIRVQQKMLDFIFFPKNIHYNTAL